MSTVIATKKRRAMQALWSMLDLHLSPHIEKGLVVALSGGPDSRALLESLARWPKRTAGKILVVSLDHGVREQSQAESHLAIMRAQRLGFATSLIKLLSEPHLGESVLREKRYRALFKACDSIGSRALCTAHHQDDNAEGFLMSLFGVGGGAQGAAMGPCERMDDYLILRPFVGLTKKDLLLALSMHDNTDYALDNLDQDRAGRRAWVRYEVMPQLLTHAPNIAARLDYFARLERQKRAILSKLAYDLISWSNEGASIRVAHGPEPLIIELAIQAVLNKLSKNHDLRQAAPTVAKLAGLDRSSKQSIVKHLNAKEFALPGAVAYSNSKEIIIKRI